MFGKKITCSTCNNKIWIGVKNKPAYWFLYFLIAISTALTVFLFKENYYWASLIFFVLILIINVTLYKMSKVYKEI